MHELAANLDARAGTHGAPAHGQLQRRCACGTHTYGAGECADCAHAGPLQARLGIGASDDPLELEAERVADAIAGDAFGGVIADRAPPSIQRRAAQRSTAGSAAPASVDRAVAGPGAPLDAPLRRDMERRFGHDFSGVRVHTGAAAEQSARDVDADAYTVGRHIVFGARRFAPATHAGRRLLAHELTHVVQQSGSAAPIAPRVQRQGTDAGTAAVTLGYTARKPVQGQCGDFRWEIKWFLNGATEKTNGFIVQKVKAVSLTQKCDDSPDDVFNVWWEAWQVRDGKIMSGVSDRESLGDSFTWSNTNGTKGTTYVTGAAKFIEGYQEPLKWGRLKEAGPLPATRTQPPGWEEKGSKYRYIGVSGYFCCDTQYRTPELVTEELDV